MKTPVFSRRKGFLPLLFFIPFSSLSMKEWDMIAGEIPSP